jgi:glucan endo-1,3-alpha-glucosidase
LKYADNPNQLQVNGKTFVSTFAGESCNFGAASVPEGWSSQFSKHPDLDGKITFAPAFFIDPTGFSDFGDVMDGSFNVCSIFLSHFCFCLSMIFQVQWRLAYRSQG